MAILEILYSSLVSQASLLSITFAWGSEECCMHVNTLSHTYQVDWWHIMHWMWRWNREGHSNIKSQEAPWNTASSPNTCFVGILAGWFRKINNRFLSHSSVFFSQCMDIMHVFQWKLGMKMLLWGTWYSRQNMNWCTKVCWPNSKIKPDYLTLEITLIYGTRYIGKIIANDCNS